MARRSKTSPFVTFLVGGVIGSAAALMFAPASGKETRQNLNENINRLLVKANDQKKKIMREAQVTAENILERTRNIYKDSIRFAEGTYTSSAGAIDREIQNIRRAVNAAVEAYRNKPVDSENPYRNEVVVNEMFTDFEDESLPKQEGMGRRV